MIPFKNNLCVGDEVENVKLKRRGKVHNQPQSRAVNVMVLLDGLGAPRYFPVMDLRFVVDGKAEDAPPIEGTPPTWERDTEKPAPPPAPPAPADPVAPRRAGPPAPAKLPTAVTSADAAYEGDVTVERLFEVRRSLREQLDALDERLMMLRVQVMLRRQLEPIRAMAELEDRCDIAADAMKIKRDAADAITLAKRVSQPNA